MTAHPPPDSFPRRLFTVAEVEAMVAAGIIEGDERVELINGELVSMSAKGRRHEVVKEDLVDRWIRSRPDDVRLISETTFRLSDETYVEPDIVIYPRTEGQRALLAETVLLVVEISDSSFYFDVGRKAALYASFGVRELWVIDAVRLKIRAFRDPSADGYREQHDFSAQELAMPFVAPSVFALRLADLDLE